MGPLSFVSLRSSGKVVKFIIMAKSILFLLAAVSLASAGLVIEDEKVLPWQSKAFEWLCTEVSKGKTNQEVAEYISTQLSIYYAPGVFTVYVGTVNCKTMGQLMISRFLHLHLSK